MGDWKKSEAQLRKTINDMNVVTGGNDTNIVDGVNRLIRGYGGAASPKLQDKFINENGTYQADNGYDGLGTVTVEVVNSEANTFTTSFIGFVKELNNDRIYSELGEIVINNILLEGEVL